MSTWFKFFQLKRPYLQFSKHSKFLSLTLAIFLRKQPIEIFGIIWFRTFPDFVHARFCKIAFKTSSFQCSYLPLDTVLGFIIIIIILCVDDGIDQKRFHKKCFFNIFTFGL